MKFFSVLLLSLMLAGCAEMGVDENYADSDDDSGDLLGAAVEGLFLGAIGAEAPAMNPDGSGPNVLDTLNAANAAIARRNAQNQAQLESNIAQLRGQAQAQEAARLARARQDAERAAQARANAAAARPQLAQAGQAGNYPAGTRAGPNPAAREAAERQASERQVAERQAAERRNAERLAVEQKAAEARQQAEEARKREAADREAERKRREEEANRPIAYREGVVLCKQVSKKNWRCEGPLQMTYSDGELDAPIGIGALKMACGTSKRVPRKIGMVSDYMAYGCGYGIHPHANMRDYPGNRDVQAMLGVGYIPDLGTFHCKPSVSAYCNQP
jgi:hypothetical protein